MISSDVIRGHLETVILKCINEKDMYGYEIATVLTSKSNGEFNIKEATLYSVVQRLEKKMIIESYHGNKTHGGKRKYYRMTTLGKAYFVEKCNEWEELTNMMGNLLGGTS